MSRWNRQGVNPTPEPTWTWRTKVIAAIALVIVALLIITVLTLTGDPPPQANASHNPSEDPWVRPSVDIPPVEDKPEKDAPPARMVDDEQIFAELSDEAEEQKTQQAEGKEPNPAIVAALKGGVKVASAKDGGHDGTAFASTSGGCRIGAGTVIKAWQETASTNTNPGGALARVRFNVTGEGGCDGIRAGALFVGNVEQGAAHGAERTNFVYHTIEQEGRPPVDIETAAADAMGKAGVPGEVDHHTSKIAWRVGLSTATGILDSAASSIVSFGGIPMRESSRAIDNWANQAINLAPTLETDPSQSRVPVTIILQKAIVL